ncbi:TPA: virulence protein, partial [Streptococcus suis]
MGLKYSSTDSQNLITSMRTNLILANQITDRLSSGCDHLIATLESGELKGAAYTAGKGLFTEVIIPAIKKLQAAIDDIQAELTSYEYADSIVAEYGILDLDNLEQQLELKYEQLSIVEDQLEINTKLSTQASALFSGEIGELWSQNLALDELKAQIQMGIDDVKERIEKLNWFNTDVSKYFSDSLTVLQLAIQGALALSNITMDEHGNYYSNGSDMSWLNSMTETVLFTTDRGTDPKVSLINDYARDLMLSDEATAYYRKQLTTLLDGQPTTEWPFIIA